MRFLNKLLILGLILMVSFALAQNVPETPFTSNLQWGVGAKAMGMGGAFTAVADNHAALYYNPAGLGQLEKSQIFWNFSQRSIQNTSTFYESDYTEESTFTKFDGLGLAIKVPTSQGSMVLSFSYNRVGSFDGSLFVEDPDLVVSFDYDEDGDLDDFDPVKQSYEWLQEGGLTQTSFGLSVEVAPKVYVGGAINFWGGEKEYTWRFEEIAGLWDVYNADTGEEFIVELPDYLREDTYRERYSGANLSLGFLAAPIPMIKLGGTIKSPLTLKGKRDWKWYEEEWYYIFDEVANDYTDEQESFYDEEEGYIEHKVQSPWVLRTGLAATYGPVTLSGDIEVHDYSQLKFKTEPPEDIYRTASEANRAIRKELKNTLNYHLGGEVVIAPINASLRGGLAHFDSPYQSTAVNLDRDVYSVGMGFNFSNQILVDAAYAMTEYKKLPGDVITGEKIKTSKFLVTMTYQF